MPTYALTSVQIPAPVIPTDFIDPLDGAPDALTPLTNGMVPVDAVPVWHEWARSIEAMGREGAGARCINRGLIPSDSGDPLTVEVSAGQACIDIPVTLAEGGSVTVSNNIYNAGDLAVRIHLWITQGGTLTSVNNSLTPPSTNCVYLGSCRTSAGAFVDFDLSGRMQRLQGGVIVRRTADAGEPADTPPSTISFRAKTAGGIYEWSGEEWIDAAFDSKTVYTSGDHATSGTLADLITVGEDAGLTVDVEEVGGEWVLVLRSVLGDVDLTGFLKTDGTNAMLQPLNFGSFKGIGLANGTLSTDAANVGQMNAAIAAAIAAVDLTVFFKKDGTRKATGDFDLDGHEVKNIPDTPSALTSAINGNYLAAELAGFSTTDRFAGVGASDTTPDYLSNKITTTSDLDAAVDGSPSTNQHLKLSLTPHTEVIPNISVDIPRGGGRLIRVLWGDRGAFSDNGDNADPLYSVKVSAYSDSTASGSLIVEEALFCTSFQQSGYAAGVDDDAYRTAYGTLLWVADQSTFPDSYMGAPDELITVELTLRVSGFGWEVGGSPSADPDVTVFAEFGRHVETFELTVPIAPGEKRRYRCDFDGRGTFSDDYQVRLQPDQEGIACTVLDSHRLVKGWDGTSGFIGKFDFDIEMASDATDTEGDDGETIVRVTLQGARWFPNDPEAVPTVTEDTLSYPSLVALTSTRKLKEIGLFHPDVDGASILLIYPMTETTWIGGTASEDSQGRYGGTGATTTNAVQLYHYAAGGGSTWFANADWTAGTPTAVFDFFAGETELSPGDWLQAEWAGDTGTSGFVSVALIAEVAA